MNKQHDGYQVVPFPKARRGLIDVMRSGQHMHVIHALLEVDVTKVRAYLREQKARTGEAFSFTAFIATAWGRPSRRTNTCMPIAKAGISSCSLTRWM